MAKFSVKRGATSQIIRVFIQDTTKTDGSGLIGLTATSANLVCYFTRIGDAVAATQVVLTNTGTLGTYGSGFFKEVDAINAPGEYELHLPDAIFQATGNTARVYLRGAANMAINLGEIQIDAVDYQSSTNFITGVNGNILLLDSAGRVTPIPSESIVIKNGTAQAGGASTITLDTAASITDNSYVTHTLSIVSGTGAGGTRQVIGYVGSTKVATVNRPWSTGGVPDSTSVFAMYKFIGPIVPADGSVTAGTVNDKSGYSLTGGSVPTVVQIRTEMDTNSTKLANLDAAITTRISLAQVLNAPRDVSSVADNALTVNDAFHAAIVEMAGQEVIAGTVDTKKTPAGTVVRVFTLNSATTPTQRV